MIVMPDPVPNLDLTQITFPTDNITVRDIRQDWYRKSASATGSTSLLRTLEDLLETERELVEHAFYAALGVKLPGHVHRGIGGADGAREALEASYVEFGLAAGEHVAEKLIRDLESQAAAQARGIPGRPRPR